jgi:hypothetical protein
LQHDFAGLTDDFADLQNDFAGLTDDFAALQNDFADLQNDFAATQLNLFIMVLFFGRVHKTSRKTHLWSCGILRFIYPFHSFPTC